eukprot:TRINITY_DN6366_c0_g1_i2.p1 TRINITY_DN6366_c0_g1~~TRINITY_DN6366_c0_g1_i2.p1  ORF type:complete len:290 (-),score=54.87 TRINITY_DN6366_c0_g1_i2:35-904(-)
MAFPKTIQKSHLSITGEEEDAVIVEDDDSETSAAGDVQTRLFTGNSQLDAGLAGLALGVGGALVVGHLLGEAENNNQKRFRCQRFKRSAEEPSLRFLNLGGLGGIGGGGSSSSHQNCPPGTYPVPYQANGNQYNGNNFNGNQYHGNQYNGNQYNGNQYKAPYPSSGPYNPSHQGSYNRPQHHNTPIYPSPSQNNYNAPSRRPVHGPHNRPQGYPSTYTPVYTPSTPYVQRQNSVGNGYVVPSSPVRRPNNVAHGGSSFFEPRSALKSTDFVENPKEEKEKKRSDAVRFV